jgi:hypothetical protein
MLALAGAAGGALALPWSTVGWAAPGQDRVADIYLDVLHEHTRWVEQQWDATIGAYAAAEFGFIVVLGNAVLLRAEKYDPVKAGVPKARLKTRTLATIERFAASNRLAGGDEWGQQLFWDSTFELYFVLAARLLWDDLGAETQANVQKIAGGQAAYVVGLGTADDPLSGQWSPNGTAGGWAGDTKLAEMGVYAQALAPGLAWYRDDPKTREHFVMWATNASGLPAADRINDAVVDGRRIGDRATAHNIHDSFIVENHGSADPQHQAELWRTAGRAAIHFLVAGKPLPQVLTRPPNGEQLWRTLRLLASDAGEPVLPMVADHYHGYGRDVLPLAFLAQVQGDADAARAEADLAARLTPYLRHEPAYRLTKVAGADEYESQARAELAIAYLFHRYRDRPTPPNPAFFRDASGTRDFGAEIGMVVHQCERAFAAAVTKDGFVRFLWQPGHDNWLVDSRAPGFLPPGRTPTGQWITAYEKVRDGVDATVTVLTLGEQQYAGFATLPTGTVIYASTGLGAGEGSLTIFNLAMPGVPGLTGTRTFTSAGGELVLSDREASGDGGTDHLTFSPRPARYVRMLAREAATGSGYSIWTFAVLDKEGADLAQGALPGASSSDVTFPARNATDGNPLTRWAVDHTEVGRPDGWLAVDLGSLVTVAGVRIEWADAYATRYVIQTSSDAVTWEDAVVVPKAHKITGGWVGIDGRAGLVSRGPITITANGVSAPARLIEGYVDADLAAAARRTLPTAEGLQVSDADGHLTVFNLAAGGVTSTVTTPWIGRIYRGVQTATAHGLQWTVTLAGGTALVEPPRFTIDGPVPPGTRFDVADSRTVTVTAPPGQGLRLTVRTAGRSVPVRLKPGAGRTLTVPGSPVTPTADRARGRTTFPTSPLPAGMTSPGRAVDGDPATSWRPGPSGRMVVDLGVPVTVGDVCLTWTSGPVRPVRLALSLDGLDYFPYSAATPVPARYLMLTVEDWHAGDAELIEVAAFPGSAPAS